MFYTSLQLFSSIPLLPVFFLNRAYESPTRVHNSVPQIFNLAFANRPESGYKGPNLIATKQSLAPSCLRLCGSQRSTGKLSPAFELETLLKINITTVGKLH